MTEEMVEDGVAAEAQPDAGAIDAAEAAADADRTDNGMSSWTEPRP